MLGASEGTDLDVIFTQVPRDGLGQPYGTGSVAVDADRIGGHVYILTALGLDFLLDQKLSEKGYEQRLRRHFGWYVEG